MQIDTKSDNKLEGGWKLRQAMGFEQARDYGRSGNNGQWRMIRNRTLGYLDAIGVPPVEALEISLQVIEEVRSRIEADASIRPVETAMQVLRRILKKHNRIEGKNGLLPDDAELISQPLPPRKRGNMTPQNLEGGRPGSRLFSKTLKMFKFILPLILLFVFIGSSG